MLISVYIVYTTNNEIMNGHTLVMRSCDHICICENKNGNIWIIVVIIMIIIIYYTENV